MTATGDPDANHWHQRHPRQDRHSAVQAQAHLRPAARDVREARHADPDPAVVSSLTE